MTRKGRTTWTSTRLGAVTRTRGAVTRTRIGSLLIFFGILMGVLESFPVSNWRRLPEGEKPKPGDAAAIRYPGGSVGATGHAGFSIKDPSGNGVSNISAHHDTVYTVEDQFFERNADGGSDVAYLRYTGD